MSCDSENQNFISGILLRDYILLETLGYGTFSQVWSCIHKTSGKMYAIKIQNTDFEDCVDTEIEHYTKLNNNKKLFNTDQYINPFHEHFEYIFNDQVYYCLIFSLAACNLYDIIKYYKYKNKNVFTIDTIISIIKQLLNAIAICDKLDIIHTDIKPENLLVQGLSTKMQQIQKLFKVGDIDKIFQTKKKLFYKKNKNKKKFDQDKLYQKVVLDYVNKLFVDLEKNYKNNDKSDNNDNKSDNKSDNDNNDNKSNETIETQSIDSEQTYDSYNISSSEESSILSKPDVYLSINIDNINDGNLTIKLADFGSAQKNGEIVRIAQTRHYRAPEILLRCKYDNKCDIWSVGCLMFELLTGHVLFDPKKTCEYSTNKNHIIKMYELFGPMPKNVINSSLNKKYYFNNDHTVKTNCNIKSKNIELVLNEYELYNSLNIDINKKNNIIEFLNSCFTYESQNRLSAIELLNHKLFQI